MYVCKTRTGASSGAERDWVGARNSRQATIGLKLDLGRDRLTLFKNGKRLGVLVSGGLVAGMARC